MDRKTRYWAGLSYLPPIFILSLIKGKNSLVICHARQAALIWSVVLVAWLISLPSGNIYSLLKWPLASSAWVFAAYLLLLGVVDVARGTEELLPFIGGIAAALPRFKK